MRGLAAAGGVYVISIILEDTLRTAIAEMVFDRAVQSYIYQSVVWFTLAFVGSFIARRNFIAAIILLTCIYWVVGVSDYLQNFASAALDPPTDIELLIEITPFALVSIVSVIVGSLAGQRFGRSDSAAATNVRYIHRKRALFLSMLGLCVVVPQAYSAYWFSEAQDEARKALNSIKSGTIPENVELYASELGDWVYPLGQLMETYSDQSEVVAVHKNGSWFHGYDIRIISNDETPIIANADYMYGEWSISCCAQY